MTAEKIIEAEDATGRFGELLAQVLGGERFAILQGGQVVAHLSPESHRRFSAADGAEEEAILRSTALWERWKVLGEGVTLGPDLAVRQLIEDGRE